MTFLIWTVLVFDLLIRDARVVDGTGNPWYRADVGIQSGKISAIGRLNATSAARLIDAHGRVLAPGFIDVHTHLESAIEKTPRSDNYLMDGVTTAVTGNCGGSAPDLTVFFNNLEKLQIGLNVASLVGHNTVRRQVMETANRLELAVAVDAPDQDLCHTAQHISARPRGFPPAARASDDWIPFIEAA
jgi:N-acyl-D-amino-acid deacylase